MANEVNVLNNTESPQVEVPKEQERINVTNIPPKSIGQRELNSIDILSFVYPIGSIYISTVSTNPATLFGFGTWVAFGAGKTLVGIDTTDADFDTAEETGGAKTKTIAQANLPNISTGAGTAHSHTFTDSATGAGTLYAQIAAHGDSASYSPASAIGSENAHTHSLGGSGTALNVMNPYIVCYFFRRSA